MYVEILGSWLECHKWSLETLISVKRQIHSPHEKFGPINQIAQDIFIWIS